MKTHHDSTVAFIVSNLNSLACIYALQQKYDEQTYVLNRYKDLQYYNIVFEALSKEYSNTEILKQLEHKIQQIQSNINQQKILKMAEISASPIPEIILPTPEGDSVSLISTLKKNKIILLHFWASWDETSIKQNIELKKAYSKYHPKGLEIYSISLDTDIDQWSQAIKFDSITWINVSELNYPNSEAEKIYNISKIPYNYLINKDGEILAKNLKADRMWDHLEKAFNVR